MTMGLSDDPLIVGIGTVAAIMSILSLCVAALKWAELPMLGSLGAVSARRKLIAIVFFAVAAIATVIVLARRHSAKPDALAAAAAAAPPTSVVRAVAPAEAILPEPALNVSGRWRTEGQTCAFANRIYQSGAEFRIIGADDSEPASYVVRSRSIDTLVVARAGTVVAFRREGVGLVMEEDGLKTLFLPC
jgi:hypothetical protein